MGGKILEFSADKYYNAGLEKGREIGLKIGREIGREIGSKTGEEMLASVLGKLLKEGKMDDIARAASDKAYREDLDEKYGIG